MSIETVRELETLASVCPELNMANYTEDDVRHLNDWAIEMSLLVERYALSQQPDNAACKSVQKRLAAQQPATAIACGIPGMAKTTCPYCEQGFAFEHEQPATGEPFGYIHHFAAHDERGALIDTTWEADGCADPLPHPTSPAMWKWSHFAPFYTTQQPTQATQATPSIPSDGPSTYAQRFTAAVALICGVTPPAALVCDWINKEERHDDLQQWVGSYAPGWVQNIAVLDAAHQMADQPTEGSNHEPAQQPATGEPVQADSSGHLSVIASLGAALRRLSFAAQTTGGTAGPDAELQSAIRQAEQALSFGGIGQAMFATPGPVGYMNAGNIHELKHGGVPYGYVYPQKEAGVSIPVYDHPAPGVLKDDQIAALVNKVRDIARMFNDHQSLRERIAIELVPALKVSQEVKRNAERYRWLMSWLQQMNLLKAEFGQMGKGEKPADWWMLNAPYGIDKTRPFFGHGKTADAAIDAAMLTAAQTHKGQP